MNNVNATCSTLEIIKSKDYYNLEKLKLRNENLKKVRI